MTNDPTNTSIQETLSAFLDGETGKPDALELRRLVQAMDSDPSLLGTAARYSLSSRLVARQSVISAEPLDFLARVNQELETRDQHRQQAVAATPRASTAPRMPLRWLRPAGKVAVAASVALVSILAVRYWGGQQQGFDKLVTLAHTNTNAASTPVVTPTTTAVPALPENNLASGQMEVGVGPHVADADPVTVPADPGFDETPLQDHWTYHLERASLNEAADGGCDADGDEPDAANVPWKLKLPNGYKLCSYEDTRDQVEVDPAQAAEEADKVNPNVVVYSDGEHTLSVFVNDGNELANGQVSQDHLEGSTLLHSEQVTLNGQSRTVTVIGEIPADEAQAIVHSLQNK